MKFNTGFFDGLFGKKVTLQLPQDDGTTREVRVTKAWLEKMTEKGELDYHGKPSEEVLHDNISPNDIVIKLDKYRTELVSLMDTIDGPINNHLEIGIFIASIATMQILNLKVNDPPKFADSFNMHWINDTMKAFPSSGITKDILIKRLQDMFPIYCGLVDEWLKAGETEQRHNIGVQLTWELFSNCTKKTEPAHFIKLVLASGGLMGITINISREIYVIASGAK